MAQLIKNTVLIFIGSLAYITVTMIIVISLEVGGVGLYCFFTLILALVLLWLSSKL